MKYGDMKIAIEHGKNVYLAAFITGYVTDKLKAAMRGVLERVEAKYGVVLKSWDGTSFYLEDIGAFQDELISWVGPGKNNPPK